jgi:hypothetical protein
MAAHWKSDRCRDDLFAGGLRKFALAACYAAKYAVLTECCPLPAFSTELLSVGLWSRSRLWPEERAKKFSDLPAWVCFSDGLGSSPAFFTTLLCRRWSRCWRGNRRHCWRGSELWRSGWRRGERWRRGWQFHGRRCSDSWRSYSGRQILASWLVCETLGNSRDNCQS